MTKTIEIEADTVDDATAEAAAALGVTPQQLDVEVLEEPSRGLFGLGGRLAKVRARVRAAAEASPAPLAAAEEPRAAVRQPADTPEDGEAAERARTVLAGIVEQMGLSVEIAAAAVDGAIVLTIEGDTGGLLIGRRGQTLDALEYLVNRILGSSSPRITLDCQDYRARRQASLEDLALRLAERARERGRVVTMDPMPPRDRRIVHLTLRDVEGVTTRSSGDSHLRKLLIVPDRADRRR